MIPTNNPLDLAIEGNGFFQVANPNGGASFIRSGSFNLNAAGNVDIAEEMVDEIVAKAAFKVNVNVIKANGEMIGSLLDNQVIKKFSLR